MRRRRAAQGVVCAAGIIGSGDDGGGIESLENEVNDSLPDVIGIVGGLQRIRVHPHVSRTALEPT